MKRISLAAILASMLVFMFTSAVQAQTPQDTLNQYVANLQKNPSDTALREKIIKLAQEMRPPPALPDEAQKHLDRGVAAIEGAKSEEDFKDACAEFTKVLTIAPWFGRGYRPLAVAQDKAGQYDAALKNLEFYLLSQPSPEDAAWAKSLINKIEYRKEKAAKESSPAVTAEIKQDPFEALLKKIDGRRYTGSADANFKNVLDVRGKVLVIGVIATQAGYYESPDPAGSRFEIRGREVHVPCNVIVYGNVRCVERIYIISEDGERITVRVWLSDGAVREYIYLWQR